MHNNNCYWLQDQFDPVSELLEIPEYREEFIDLKVSSFIELLDLESSPFPSDCIEIMEKVKEFPYIHIEYIFADLSERVYSLTRYIDELDLYIVFINSNLISYPSEHSRFSALNISVLNELAHILLGHYSIPDNLKTERDLVSEWAEAADFVLQIIVFEDLKKDLEEDLLSP